jgi:hypothetical protein
MKTIQDYNPFNPRRTNLKYFCFITPSFTSISRSDSFPSLVFHLCSAPYIMSIQQFLALGFTIATEGDLFLNPLELSFTQYRPSAESLVPFYHYLDLLCRHDCPAAQYGKTPYFVPFAMVSKLLTL